MSDPVVREAIPTHLSTPPVAPPEARAAARRQPPSSARFFGDAAPVDPPGAPRGRTPAKLRAARRLLRQNGGDFQALPPSLQRAVLADRKRRDPAAFRRAARAHALGDDATPADRYAERMAKRDPRRLRQFQAQQARADRAIAADADPEKWRRIEVARREERRSRELLARDPGARRGRHEKAAMESIQQSSAPDATDRAWWQQRIQASEREQLTRGKAAWRASLPADRRAALQAREARDDASILASGRRETEHADVVKDVLTFGANSASKTDGAAGTAAELLTLGSAALARAGARDLGRASAYRAHEELQAPADALQRSGALQLGLAALNLVSMKGTARAAAVEAREALPAMERPALPSGVTWTREADGVLTRRTADPHGGPDWTVRRTDDAIWRTREVPAGDGGPDWTEVDRNFVPIERTREVPAADGGPAWSERETGGRVVARRQVPGHDGRGDWAEIREYGQTVRSRQYDEAGQRWLEAMADGHRWRVRAGGAQGLQREARSRGLAFLRLPGVGGLRVWGGARPDELRTIERVWRQAPAAARSHATDIYLSERLGEVLGRDGSRAPIAGLGGDGGITIDRACLQSAREAKEVMYHEAGHNFDRAAGVPRSSQGPWGRGASVSPYGEANAMEDFAEVHRAVLQSWNRLKWQPAWGWAFESCPEKKAEMLRLYGVDVRPGTARDLVWPAVATTSGGAVLLWATREKAP